MNRYFEQLEQLKELQETYGDKLNILNDIRMVNLTITDENNYNDNFYYIRTELKAGRHLLDNMDDYGIAYNNLETLLIEFYTDYDFKGGVFELNEPQEDLQTIGALNAVMYELDATYWDFDYAKRILLK